MAIDFHKDMDKYLTGKRRKRLLSDIKSRVMNKKASISAKASDNYVKIKGTVKSRVEKIKKRKKEEKEITQQDIESLVQKKGREKKPKVDLEKKMAGKKLS